MKRFVVGLFSLLLLFAGSAWALEFSADTVMTTKESKVTGKMYFGAEKFRMEMKAPEEMVTITRMDKKVVWNVMPKQGMYMEMPLVLKNKPMVEEKMAGEIERKVVGSETVDGHPTKKYLITYRAGDNKDNQVYQWWATDINFPVKTSAIDGSWVQEYRNVKIGPQPDSLFQVPTGYKKFQMPGGMNFPAR